MFLFCLWSFFKYLYTRFVDVVAVAIAADSRLGPLSLSLSLSLTLSLTPSLFFYVFFSLARAPYPTQISVSFVSCSAVLFCLVF